MHVLEGVVYCVNRERQVLKPGIWPTPIWVMEGWNEARIWKIGLWRWPF